MTYTLASKSLQELLERARALIQEQGSVHETQRGRTYSLNNVMLTWERPQPPAIGWPEADAPLAQEVDDSYFYWDKTADDWYQKFFVEKRDENDPAMLPEEGTVLYAYTYAHRSRFWDGGWGYVLSIVRALQHEGITVLPAAPDDALDMVKKASRAVHVQIVIAVFAWLGKETLERFLADPDSLERMVQLSRIDTLQHAIDEIQVEPSSRRAVTAAFTYPSIDFLVQPAMALPPYQFFQLLPAESDSEPLTSAHVHRSLDVAGGAQLDFHHDLSWLTEAARFTGRSVGDITVVAHNLHLYVPGGDTNNEHLTSKTTIAEWLNGVVGGYRAYTDEHEAVLANDVYKKHVARLLEAWHH